MIPPTGSYPPYWVSQKRPRWQRGRVRRSPPTRFTPPTLILLQTVGRRVAAAGGMARCCIPGASTSATGQCNCSAVATVLPRTGLEDFKWEDSYEQLLINSMKNLYISARAERIPPELANMLYFARRKRFPCKAKDRFLVAFEWGYLKHLLL